MVLSAQSVNFQNVVTDFYARHGRHDLLWRQPNIKGEFDPYVIMVSEIMLQQTGVQRVTPKFMAFIALFPTVMHLASAPLADVLRAWQGLGYNRRAKFLWQAAGQIVERYEGEVPLTIQELVTLPGIGKNTAGAILAYAYDMPVVFIETNIRTVFIHHFFADELTVSDAVITTKVAETLPSHNVREWYWALMDYGSYVKKSVGNLSRASSSYVKQSAFEGSRRQVRGHVLRLLAQESLTLDQLARYVDDNRLMSVLDDLYKEGFVARDGDQYALAT